jgi:hypothetical protein
MKYVSTGWYNTVSRMTEEMSRLSAGKMVRFTQILMSGNGMGGNQWCGVVGYDDFAVPAGLGLRSIMEEFVTDNIGT